MRFERFFLREGELEAGARVRLDDDESRHLAGVLRKAEGGTVTLFNGDGREATARHILGFVPQHSVGFAVASLPGGRIFGPQKTCPSVARVAVTYHHPTMDCQRLDGSLRIRFENNTPPSARFHRFPAIIERADP